MDGSDKDTNYDDADDEVNLEDNDQGDKDNHHNSKNIRTKIYPVGHPKKSKIPFHGVAVVVGVHDDFGDVHPHLKNEQIY